MSIRKKKIPPTFPCECGHSKRLHEVDLDFGKEWCNGSGKKGKYISYAYCDCDKYVSDNLKYLEQIVRKKG